MLSTAYDTFSFPPVDVISNYLAQIWLLVDIFFPLDHYQWCRIVPIPKAIFAELLMLLICSL